MTWLRCDGRYNKDIKTKKTDIADFENRLRSSDLFTDPAGSPDSYLAQFETTVTTVLNQVAPLKVGHRPGGRRGARWLDPEAITAKQHRRRLERRWKKTGSDPDRATYRDACRHTNKLINASRNHTDANVSSTPKKTLVKCGRTLRTYSTPTTTTRRHRPTTTLRSALSSPRSSLTK